MSGVAVALLCAASLICDAAPQDAAEAKRLFASQPHTWEGWQTAVELVTKRAEEDATLVRRQPWASPAQGTNWSRPVALAVLEREARAHACQDAWWVVFDEVTGIFRVHILDVEYGLHHAWGTKVRSVAGETLSEEHHAKVVACVGRLLTLRDETRQRAMGKQLSPDQRWQDDEDPVHFGFDWRYEPGGVTRVHRVWSDASAARARLRAGDVIKTVDGEDVPSPAHFGRALLGRQVGDAISFGVRRDGEALECVMTVARTSDVVRAVETACLGKTLTELGADRLSNGDVDEEASTSRLIVCIDPQRPETSELLQAALWWMTPSAAHVPGKPTVAVDGLLMGADASACREIAELLDHSAPLHPDPDGDLSFALGVSTAPSALWVDEAGRILGRAHESAALHAMIRAGATAEEGAR